MKLSDSQLVVLTAACQHPDRRVLPLPPHLKGGAAGKVVESLAAKGLIVEVAAKRGDVVWREANGASMTLAATDAAFAALGIELADEPPAGTITVVAPEALLNDDTVVSVGIGADGGLVAEIDDGDGVRTVGVTVSGEDDGAAAEAPPRPRRDGTKQAKLISMLRDPDGATLDDIVAATGWQKHTVRGTLAGALKKKLGLAVTSEKVEGRGRVYRIEP